MSRKSIVRFGCHAVCAAFFAGLSGCLLPVAYPCLTHVPGIRIGEDHDQAHAFRVDETLRRADLSLDERDLLTPISLSGDAIPAQFDLSVTHGLYVVGVALNYPIITGHSVAVRLYRPGYELIEVKPGENVDKADWKAAPDLASQEKALDDLFCHVGRDGDSHFLLAPGSASATHKQALYFGAAEYERLASGQATTWEDLTFLFYREAQNGRLAGPPAERGKESALWRLTDKAMELRALAEK
jgi:hypothetical protein